MRRNFAAMRDSVCRNPCPRRQGFTCSSRKVCTGRKRPLCGCDRGPAEDPGRQDSGGIHWVPCGGKTTLDEPVETPSYGKFAAMRIQETMIAFLHDQQMPGVPCPAIDFESLPPVDKFILLSMNEEHSPDGLELTEIWRRPQQKPGREDALEGIFYFESSSNSIEIERRGPANHRLHTRSARIRFEKTKVAAQARSQKPDLPTAPGCTPDIVENGIQVAHSRSQKASFHTCRTLPRTREIEPHHCEPAFSEPFSDQQVLWTVFSAEQSVTADDDGSRDPFGKMQDRGQCSTRAVDKDRLHWRRNLSLSKAGRLRAEPRRVMHSPHSRSFF